VAGALLFAAPRFFYTYVAPIGDYSAHYARDLGSFLLPLGGFLIVAAWRTSSSRPLLGFAAVASGPVGAFAVLPVSCGSRSAPILGWRLPTGSVARSVWIARSVVGRLDEFCHLHASDQRVPTS
jgi:hypothetical protein